MKYILAVVVLIGTISSPSAQQLDGKFSAGCAPFDAAVFATPGSVPDPLLQAPEATDCLMGTLKTISGRNVAGQLSADDQLALVRASGALGKLIDKGGIDAIQKMREIDDTQVVDLLSYGATSTDYDTRLNSTNLLSNIIDNSTVCVAMDHLADPSLGTTQDGIKGRANLLASVSVVAPWATKSNYANMQVLNGYLAKQVQPGTLAKTEELLKNFTNRLDYQKGLPVGKANMNFDSPDLLAGCQAYQPKWATSGEFVLNYPAQ